MERKRIRRREREKRSEEDSGMVNGGKDKYRRYNK